MLEEINNKLKSLNEKILLKSKYECRLEELSNLIDKKKKEIGIFNEQLEKEKKDVEKLKSFTLTNLITTLSGKKEEKLSKEEYEYLNAKIKYDRLNIELDNLHDECSKYNESINVIKGIEKEYSELIEAKKTIIINSNSNKATLLSELSIKNDDISKELIEVKEAITAGVNCKKSLIQTETLLVSAQKWGTADMFMDSMLISLAKHNKLDKANVQISKAKSYLERFVRELKDVSIHLDSIDLNFSGFLKTFDIFFDNIFTDLSVQSRISSSLTGVRSILKQVDDTLSRLYRIREGIDSEFGKNEKEINNIINEY